MATLQKNYKLKLNHASESNIKDQLKKTFKKSNIKEVLHAHNKYLGT
jgi:hypothetical protein